MSIKVSRLAVRISLSLVLSLITAMALLGSGLSTASTSIRPARKQAVRVVGQTNPYIKLQEGRDLETVYAEPSASSPSLQSVDAGASLQSEQTRPLALASGDFDGDGFPDLVSGYGKASGGLLTLHRGNRQAFSPSDPSVLEGIRMGQFPDAFLKKADVFTLPESPDFLVTGDFNRDGSLDVAVAARASSHLYLLAGNRQGGFASVDSLALPGAVTAMMADDINRRDGIADLIIGIHSDSGASMLVYDTAMSILSAAPSTYALPAEAKSFAAGDLDDDHSGDIAVVAGSQMLILHGRAQMQGLDGTALDQKAGQLETVALPFSVRAIALGEFIWNRNGQTQIAAMSEDGAVHIVARGQLDTTPMTVEEMQKLRRKMAKQRKAAEQAAESGEPIATASQSTEPLKWEVIEDISESTSIVTAARASDSSSAQLLMLGTRMSGLPSDDLLIMNGAAHRLQIMYRAKSEQKADLLSAQAAERSTVEFDSDGEMVAALPMRVSVDGRPGLVVLSKGGSAPTVFTPQANSTYVVNTASDTDDANTGDGLCQDGSGNCSLRAAVQQANADLVNDTITFSAALNGVPIQLTQVGNDSNAGQGDLDINSNITITGNGAANTIIQGATDASFTGAMGDKIFGINQDGIFDNLTVSVTGVTIRYARNTVPFGDPSFAYTGGGVDMFLTGSTNSISFTDCTIDNNANAFSYGGGVNIDSFNFGSSAGTVSFTGCTISNNKLQSTTIPQNGAGANLFADNHNVLFANCTITANQAPTVNFAGGINIRHSNGGTITISSTNVTNNTAGSRSGGIETSFNQTVNMNLGSITGNSASGNGGGFNASGGSVNLSNLTIANNSSTASGGGLFVGGSTLNASLNRIVGNTAASGSGIARTAGIAIVENNWWGCDGFPNAAGCQTGTGTFDADPRIDLRLLPTSVTLPPGGTQGFTADVSQNSDGVSINPVVLNGLTITFGNTAGLGTVSPGSAVLSGLMASTTFTANATCPVTNPGTVSATLDNGTQTSSVAVQEPIVLSACPANQTVSADPGVCTASVTFTAPTATAGCPTPTVTCKVGVTTITSPHTFPAGTTTVTCTASNGGVSPDQSCSFTVTVNDTQPPTVTCPANQTVNADPGVCTAVVNYTTPTGSDNCSGVTVACTPPSGSTFMAGPTTVTCTATDAVNLTGTCSFTVTVNDTQPPTIGACPANQTVNTAANQCQAVVTYTTPTASDNCSGVTVNCSPASGTAFPKGTTTVTCTATDTSSNTATCTFTVTVNDNQPPTVTCPSNINAIENSPGFGCATVNYTTPTANDNCPGATVSCSPPSGTCFPVGSTTVTCTATDTSGNMGSCSFTVNVSVACTITCPANITTGNSPNQCGAVVNYPAPSTTAGCGTVTCSPASGSFFPKGTTTVNCTTTAGPSCSFTVTVNDTQPPTITCPANIVVNLPLNTTATSMVVNFTVTATDNCPGVGTPVVSPASGTVFSVGTTTVNAMVTDAVGNTSTCSFTVTVLYDFTGFFQPVDNPPVVNLVNAGRGIPVKFSLSGNKGLNIFASGYPASGTVTCNSNDPAVELEETVTAGNSSLSYNAGSDTYTYTWATDPSWAGTCRELVVKLNDGSEHKAKFQFR